MVCLILLMGCGPLPVHELQRNPNPAGNVDAVIVERGTDATVATPTQVLVLPRGQAVSDDPGPKFDVEPVLIADHVENLQIAWLSNTRLKITAARARLFRQLPRVAVKLTDGKELLVTVEVRVTHPEELDVPRAAEQRP